MLNFQRADQLSKKSLQIFLPVYDGKVNAPAIAKLFDLNLADELSFFTNNDKPLKAGEAFDIPVSAKGYKCERLTFISLGKSTPNDIRLAGAAVGRRLRGKSESVFVDLNLRADAAKSFLISANLGSFQWNMKSGSKSATAILEIPKVETKIIEQAQVVSDAVNSARRLIHTPSNIKNPAWIAKEAKKLATGCKVEVKAGKELSEFGGLLAVGGSSPIPGPRFIKITYSPAKAKTHVVLVGKGITFDTGGISLKRPYDNMIAMKSDMAGVAACIATMSALSKLKPNAKVTALLMVAENSLSGTSQRPGDVIKHYGGKTVEVLNTDSEGRLVLADGLAYSVKHLQPDYIIDIATLTGAASLGLGKQYAALYSRDKKLVSALKSAGEVSGDRVWHMPLIDDYQSALESDIADLNHTADKGDFGGGSVTAALFLERFATDNAGAIKWAHLDIAGVGRADADAGENPKGGTGWGVRLFLEWIGALK